MSVFAYLQSASKSGNTALAFPSNNTAGNVIVVATSNNSVTAINDTQGNSYNKVANNLYGSSQIQMWLAVNINAGANSVTATGLNASGAFSSIAIIEYTTPSSLTFASGIGGSAAVNGMTGRYQSSGETLLVIASYDWGSAHSWTGTNLTVRQTVTEGGGQTLGIGDFDTTTSTTATVSTLNGGSGGATATVGLLIFQVGGGSTSSIQISLSDPLVIN